MTYLEISLAAYELLKRIGKVQNAWVLERADKGELTDGGGLERAAAWVAYMALSRVFDCSEGLAPESIEELKKIADEFELKTSGDIDSIRPPKVEA